jgi:hypothetical protein
MRRSLYLQSLLVAALAAPLLASAGPFILHNGVMTGLDRMDGPWSAAVCGLPDANGGMLVIGGLPADESSLAADINSLGQAAGSSCALTMESDAWLFENENEVMAGLATPVDPASGWTIWDAIPGPPVTALLAAGLALGLARGKESVRRPVRRRRD